MKAGLFKQHDGKKHTDGANKKSKPGDLRGSHRLEEIVPSIGNEHILRDHYQEFADVEMSTVHHGEKHINAEKHNTDSGMSPLTQPLKNPV